MSYTRLPMGATAPPVTSATQAALEIVRDPYLGEVACEVMRLHTLQASGQLGPPCARTDPRQRTSTAGVGLRGIVGPLRLYQQHVQRPWLFPAAAVGIVGLAYYLGTLNGGGR